MTDNRNTPPPYNPRRPHDQNRGGQWGEYPPQQPQDYQQPQGQPGGCPGQQPYGNQPPYGYPQQPPYGYGQPQYPPAQHPWQPYGGQRQRSNSLGTVGFIFALLSIFCGWIPVAGWIVWILGAVFSFAGLFSRPRGLAIAGVIISLVLIPVIVTILIAFNAASSWLLYDSL